MKKILSFENASKMHSNSQAATAKKNHQEIANNQTLSHDVKNQNYYEIGFFDK